MSILKVARLGHPAIRRKADPVGEGEIHSQEIQALVRQMIDSMHEHDGVGIAAPQVHVSKQIAVIKVQNNPRYSDAPEIPLTVLINPKIIQHSRIKEDGWEGCLSIPDLRGVVPRYQSVVCKALNQHGELVTIDAKGFFARVIQHECDHLEGRVYLDRMNDLTTLTHLAEFSKFWDR